MSDALVAFFRARLDEDEVPRCRHCGHVVTQAGSSARRSLTGWAHDPSDGWEGIRCPGRITGADPLFPDRARLLREVEAKRAILRGFAELDADPARFTDPVKHAIWTVMRDYAVLPIVAVWSDHPDYDPEWKP